MIFKLNHLHFTFKDGTLIPLSDSYCQDKEVITVKDTTQASILYKNK